MTTDSQTIAMLIDGDNAQPSLIVNVLAEAAKYGAVSIRRIYGDWTTPQMSGWKEYLNTHAIQPVQQFRYTTGKNATDSALIIDAMDLLHSGVVRGFCIVSSDSDYTRLATRIREQAIFVMGVGKAHTPDAFVNACDLFVYTENLVPNKTSQSVRGGNDAIPKSNNWTGMVEQAIEMANASDGWVLLSVVGDNLRKLDPAFDSRTYGHSNLTGLVKSAHDKFEFQSSDSGHMQARVRQ